MAQKASLSRQQKRSLHTQRKARTRTLIQMGGLLKVAGLLEVFGIQEGEDLQLNPQGQEKANALLGWIQAALEGTQSFKVEKVEQWKKEGKTALRVHQAKHYH